MGGTQISYISLHHPRGRDERSVSFHFLLITITKKPNTLLFQPKNCLSVISGQSKKSLKDLVCHLFQSEEYLDT